MRARRQFREQDRRRPPGNDAQRRGLQRLERLRAPRGDLGNHRAVLPQEDRAPGGVFQHPRLSAARSVRTVLDIGCEQGGFRQNRLQFGADGGRRRLDLRQPGRIGAGLELDLRQARKQIEFRLLVIQWLAPGQQVERQGEPRAGLGFVKSARLDPGQKLLLEPAPHVRQRLLHPPQLALQFGICAALLRTRQGRAVKARGGPRIAPGGQGVALENGPQDIASIDTQHPLRRRERRVGISARSSGQGVLKKGLQSDRGVCVHALHERRSSNRRQADRDALTPGAPPVRSPGLRPRRP